MANTYTQMQLRKSTAMNWKNIFAESFRITNVNLYPFIVILIIFTSWSDCILLCQFLILPGILNRVLPNSLIRKDGWLENSIGRMDLDPSPIQNRKLMMWRNIFLISLSIIKREVSGKSTWISFEKMR